MLPSDDALYTSLPSLPFSLPEVSDACDIFWMMHAAGLSIQDNTITTRVTRRNLIYLAGASLCQSIRYLPRRWCSCRECSAHSPECLPVSSLVCNTGSGGAG